MKLIHINRIGLLVASAISLTASSYVNAELVESGEQRFKSVSTATVNASAKSVYQQFLRTGEWWNLEHTWFGKDSSLSIEPKAGGCFCEINADAEVEHMRVVFVKPNHEVRLVGALGPLQMMGLNGVMSWTFTQKDDTTLIEQTYLVSGNAGEDLGKNGLQTLAPIVDKVQTEQLERLAARFPSAQKPQAK